MTPRELVIRTLNHEPVPRVPRDLWLCPGDESAQGEELAEINIRCPSDIAGPEVTPPHGKKSSGKPNKAGDYTDSWGVVWRVAQRGAPPELVFSPLSETEKITSYQPPTELLDGSRFAKVNKSCLATHRFVLAWSEVRPFDRLRQLRGSEAALVDLARGTTEIRGLLAMLHDFACKELELWAETDVDGVVLRDDWGSAEGLLIAPEMWRDIFRPLYRQYCKLLHAKDKFVFFRSDGNISDIFGDLIRVGVDAIHSQMHLMDFERLARRFRGRVTFWGEMDRRRLHDPGSPDEFRKAVLAVRKALDYGSGGVIAQCQWDPGVRVQTIATFFEHWLTPLPMHAS
jgi:uroporphyrinogen decarboxylase